MTLTLDGEKLQELRELVGGRSLSAAVDSAASAYLARMKHLAAVDDLARRDGARAGVAIHCCETDAPHRLMLLLDGEALSAIALGPAQRRDRVRALSYQMRAREMPVATVASVLAEVVRGRKADAALAATVDSTDLERLAAHASNVSAVDIG